MISTFSAIRPLVRTSAKAAAAAPSRRAKKSFVPIALAWSHCGVAYRVTPWPDVQFERLYGAEWITVEPSEAALASAAQSCGPAWAEISAIFERREVYGVLEWLGLPASRQTLTILRNISDRDVAKRFLEPLRSMLWEPRSIFALQRVPEITDRYLARACHALAA